MRNKRVLVTGGSGFIGSHLVERLIAEGAQVAIVVRYGNSMINTRLQEHWESLEVIEADVRNRGALAAISRFEPEYVFHLAAYNHVGESFRQVEECFDVNAKGTSNLLDACGGVQRFIYISTSEVYGAQPGVPFVETMAPNPISPYAITKFAGELYCRMKQAMAGSPSIVLLRPFNAFGPFQSSKAVIPELILACLRGDPVRTTKGEQTRDFNYVTNLVEGMIKAAQHPGPIDGPVNLASGEEVRICDVVRKIAELTRTRSVVEIGALPYRPTEIWRMRGDATRARELLGWAPTVSWEEGLKRTVDWFRHYTEAHPAP
jgi:nucleoside-diphosphate-sugar epimerase